MSTSFIYHALGLRDQNYKCTSYNGGGIIFEITPKPKAIRCPQCNTKSVIKRGKVYRNIRTIPVGSKPIWLRTLIQRVWCPCCQVVRQINILCRQR